MRGGFQHLASTLNLEKEKKKLKSYLIICLIHLNDNVLKINIFIHLYHTFFTTPLFLSHHIFYQMSHFSLISCFLDFFFSSPQIIFVCITLEYLVLKF